MKKEYDFSKGKRGLFKRAIALDGTGVQRQHPRIVNVSFYVTQEVAAALRALRDTGLFGIDCATVAEDLLRRALLDPAIVVHWKDRVRNHPHTLSCGCWYSADGFPQALCTTHSPKDPKSQGIDRLARSRKAAKAKRPRKAARR